ncbi:MAG: DUF2203 domain-containing protein [Thermoplasmata archaeon]
MAKRESADEIGRQRAVRLWTVARANERIAELSDLIPELRVWVERLRVVHAEIHRLRGLWGAEIDAPDVPDRRHKDRLDQEWAALTRRVEETIDGLRTDGIEIKDLEGGLVDFYARRNGEIVYLCWKTGEDRVAFYHPLDSGFRGRRPISDRS